ncbi:hypothetical protein [Paratissierella segnis]|uniref:HeH/LEM domain-containing protein n=1 Tax=Paratissierella segnis TaxID=2763679 RepID=A0A926IJJ3_9FIRM|nr:hypothetical protein [Paratissierella segnis]MBC8588089.1 hypothetical protein [Paratissierella segnis]
MYKVIREFHDKYNLKIVYKVGDEFSSNEPDRIKDLIDRGLIEGDKPFFNSMTKKEIMKVLEERSIEYDMKARKDDLIELLQGGD